MSALIVDCDLSYCHVQDTSFFLIKNKANQILGQVGNVHCTDTVLTTSRCVSGPPPVTTPHGRVGFLSGVSGTHRQSQDLKRSPTDDTEGRGRIGIGLRCV